MKRTNARKRLVDTRAYAVLKNLQNIEDIKDYQRLSKHMMETWKPKI